MNALLYIPTLSGFATIRRIVTEPEDAVNAVAEAVLKKNHTICANGKAVRQLKDIMDCRTEPKQRFIAGNAYYGKIPFEYKTDKPSPYRHIVSVKVFSALGNTIEEHDERYRRLKEAYMNNNKKEEQ